MGQATLAMLQEQIAGVQAARSLGQVSEIGRGLVRVTGAVATWPVGDRVAVEAAHGQIGGEIVALSADGASVLLDEPAEGVRLGDRVRLTGKAAIRPHEGWIGRVIDPFGETA